MSACRICSCVDDDCAFCEVLTGQPCYWMEPDLCSACAGFGTSDETRAKARSRKAWNMGHKRGSSVPGRNELIEHCHAMLRVWARLNVARMRCERVA